MVKKKTVPKVPLSLRISPELTNRLIAAAERLHTKKHTLAQDLIESAMEAIEKNSSLVVPIKFDVAQVPVSKEEKVGTPANSETEEDKKHNTAGNILKVRSARKRTPPPK